MKIKVDSKKNVWFTSFQGNSTLFKSDTNFKNAGQIIRAGELRSGNSSTDRQIEL